jgi:hypothetical protein
MKNISIQEFQHSLESKLIEVIKMKIKMRPIQQENRKEQRFIHRCFSSKTKTWNSKELFMTVSSPKQNMKSKNLFITASILKAKHKRTLYSSLLQLKKDMKLKRFIDHDFSSKTKT